MSSFDLTSAARRYWLSGIPAHWHVQRFRDLFEFVGEPDADGDWPVLSLTRSGIRVRDVSDNSGQVAEDYSGYPVIEAGTLVINPMDLVGGWAAATPVQGRISAAYFSFDRRPGAPVDMRYVEYLFQDWYGRRILDPLGLGVGRGESGGGRWTLNRSTLRSLPIPLPPLEEQRAIADYLDRETVQIDELNVRSKFLIDALNERLRSLTETLLADSPIVSKAKLGREFQFLNGDRGSAYPSRDEFRNSGAAFVNAGHLVEGKVSFESMNYLEPGKLDQLGGARLKRGDILFCLRGSLGKFGIYDSDELGTVASSIVVLRSKSHNIEPGFLEILLRSLATKSQLDYFQSGSAQPNLSVESLARFTYGIPDKESQMQIATRFQEARSGLESLSARVGLFLHVLTERRTALITAAVTGQIDLRGKVA